MKAVCMCGGVHLPYSPKWYWPVKGLSDTPGLETYFDQKVIFSRFQNAAREMLRLNSLIQESIENGAEYALTLSGPFLDQCNWNPGLIDSFKELGEAGVEFTGSCQYYSLSALYPELSEFEEQVRMHREKIKELFGVTPKTFVNTELLLTERVGKLLAGMGFGTMIAEGSGNLLNGYDPAYVYEGPLSILLRHINLSEDLEIRFSDKRWAGYPLIPEKFAEWISRMDGDVLTLYFNYTNLCLQHQNKSMLADFLLELPKELEKFGIKMIIPSEAAASFRPEWLPTLKSEQTIRYGMHNVLGNHAQNLYLRELVRSLEDLSKLSQSPNYESLKQILGYLQQVDIFFSMKAEGNMREGYERAVNYFSILSDFRRAVLEEKV